MKRHECDLHGRAFTHGCPGCEDAQDLDVVAPRLKWWRLHNLCERAGHWWRSLEPGVSRCRVCRTTKFASGATLEQFERWLLR